jgi:hypothetical protein
MFLVGRASECLEKVGLSMGKRVYRASFCS